MNYSGKTVWITGASSGIGAELARLFAEEGARVLISSHEAEELEEVMLKPKSTDITLEVFGLTWMPYRKDAGGRLTPDWQ